MIATSPPNRKKKNTFFVVAVFFSWSNQVGQFQNNLPLARCTEEQCVGSWSFHQARWPGNWDHSRHGCHQDARCNDIKGISPEASSKHPPD